MRRILIENVRPGMVLGREVFSEKGTKVGTAGTHLTKHHLQRLTRHGVMELFVEDPRVMDVVVEYLIPAEVEAEATRLLRNLIVANKGVATVAAIGRVDLSPLKTVATSMAESVTSSVLGEPAAAGCRSVKGYNWIHPVKVANLALLLAREMGHPDEDLVNLALAALLQNIGYIMVPPGILEKRGPLTEAERKRVHDHPKHGAEILTRIGGLEPKVTDTVLHHHERWDGSGYPNGLKGWDISPFAQILGIADTYHALASERYHRAAFPPMEALEFLIAYGGELFEPDMVRAFADCVPLYPAGTMVKLNNGEIGLVVVPNLGYIGRPAVRICYDQRGNPLSRPYDIDLTDPERRNETVVAMVEV